MSRVLRITLMWLIALAVPLQGSAAVTMFGCGPGHHGGMVSSQAALSDEFAPLGEPHAHGATSGEVDSGHHGRAALHDHSDSHEAHGSAQKVTKGNCAPCASCCVVAALPATVVRFEPVPLVDAFVPMTQGGVSSFLADGLERPPRCFLA